jgi:hypothetical protein
LGETITVQASADIQDPTDSSGATTGSAALGGHWGTPRVVSFYADGDAGSSGRLDVGDTMTITFDAPTNQVNNGATPNGPQMDSVFSVTGKTFGNAGMTYLFTWLDPQTLYITLSASNGTSNIFGGDTIVVESTAGIRDPGDLSDPTIDSVTLGGHVGTPRLLSVIAENHATGGVLDVGDWIILTFDAPTNTPWTTPPPMPGDEMGNRFTIHRGAGFGTFGDTDNLFNSSWAGNILVLIVNQISAGVQVDIQVGDTLEILSVAGIRDANGLSAPNADSVVITGGF